MVEIYKKLLSFKQNVNGMHLDKEGCANLTISSNSLANTFYYEIADTLNDKTYIVYHRNGAFADEEISVDLSGYELYLSTTDNNKVLSENTIVKPFETIIAAR